MAARLEVGTVNTPEVLLTCKHRVRVSWGNIDADTHYCRFDGWQASEKVELQEWHFMCRDCTAGAWTGQLKLTAGRKAGQHRRNRRGHRTVVVFDTVTKNGRGTERDNLPKDDSIPVVAGTLFDRTADMPPPF